MKNLKRILAVGASAALLVSMMAGCGANNETPAETDAVTTNSAETSPAETTAAETTAVEISDICETILGVSSDTVLATVNGEDVTALDLGYWLAYDAYYMVDYYGMDLTAEYTAADETTGTEAVTYGDYAKEDALNIAVGYILLAQQAAEGGYELTEEDLTTLADNANSYTESYGTELWDEGVASGEVVEADYTDEQKSEWIQEKGYEQYVKDLYAYCTTAEQLDHMNGLSLLYNAMAADVTDEDIATFLADNTYYGSKSILFNTLTAEDGTSTDFADMTDEQKAELRANAQTVLDEILASEDPAATLDEYMNSDTNGDPGIASYENGYIFPSGYMVTEYETGLAALEESEIATELVESADYGYFIVMRMPLDYDATTIEGGTLRETYFSQQVTSWQESAVVETNDAFAALDMQTIYDNLSALSAQLNPEEVVEETAAAETASAETASTEETAAVG